MDPKIFDSALATVRVWCRANRGLIWAMGSYVVLVGTYGGLVRPLGRSFVATTDVWILSGGTIGLCLWLAARFARRWWQMKRSVEPDRAAGSAPSHPSVPWWAWCAASGLAVGYFLVCVHFGLRLLPQHPGHDYFGADEYEWTALEWVSSHKGSHPIVPLLLAPLGVIRVFSGSVSAEALSVALNAGIGAIGLLLGFLVFFRRVGTAGAALALTGLLAASMHLLFFGALPELRTILFCSVAPTYLLLGDATERGRLALGWWLVAGVAAMGVTITNVVPTLICFGAALVAVRPADRIATWLEFGGAVFSVVLALSLVQRLIWPETHLFFVPRTVAYEQYWVTDSVLHQPLAVLADIVRNFFVFSYVSPVPEIGPWEYSREIAHVSYANVGMRFGPLGWVAAAGLLGMMLTAVVVGLRHWRPQVLFLTAIVLSVGFHCALHALYGGKIRFLYVASFTLPVLLLFAVPHLFRRRFVALGVGLVAVFAGWNNLRVLHELVSR